MTAKGYIFGGNSRPAFMKLNSDKKALFALIIVMMILLSWFYGKLLLQPNRYVCSPGLDGYKNYYSLAYHVRHDTSIFQFGGMNYPYGEQVGYTDGHPILGLLLSPFPSLGNYAVGIVNFGMIMSLLICAILLFRLLRKYKVDPWFAAFCAVGLTMLWPQVFRFNGHYSLSYAFFLPLTWLLLHNIQKSEKPQKYLLLSFLNHLVWFFIHPYLGIISVAFHAASWFFKMIFEPQQLKKSKNYLRPLVFLLPPLIFQFVMTITDHHEGRQEHPFGFFYYFAGPETVFLPTHWPGRDFLKLFFKYPPQYWGSRAYIGLPGVLTLLGIIIAAPLIWFNRKKDHPIWKWLHEWKAFLLAGTIILLFSFCIPFKWGFEGLVEYLGPIKQFRALGRFAWVFFAIIGVFSITTAAKFFTQSNGNVKWWIWIIFAFYFFEGMPYHADMKRKIMRMENSFSEQYISDELKEVLNAFDPETYQAIMPMPYFYFGAGDIEKLYTEKTSQFTFILSYHTGLPSLANALSRTSIPESMAHLELLSPGYYPKRLAAEIDDRRPFLIYYTGESLNKNEQRILNKAKLFFENDVLSLYELSYADLFANEATAVLSHFDIMKDSLYYDGTHYLSDSGQVYLFNEFETEGGENIFEGNGSFNHKKEGWSLIWDDTSPKLIPGREYMLSFWYYMKGEKQPVAYLAIDEVIDGTPKKIAGIQTKEAASYRGDWGLVELPFVAGENVDRYKAHLHSTHKNLNFYVDNLLVRPIGTDFYREFGDTLYYNNHMIIRNE